MVKVLVVDDNALDRCAAGTLLEEDGLTVVHAADGQQAIAAMTSERPDLVLTDLQMPQINGLELVELIHCDHGQVPVILMTAHGSEEIAVAALNKGAASYVPKRNLARDLVETVQSVLDVARTSHNQQRIRDCLAEAEYHFVIANDVGHIPDLIGHIQEQMVLMKLVEKSRFMQIGTALHEAVVNAIEHGNLELSSDLRVNGDYEAYYQLAEQRRRELPFRDRRVRIHGRFSSAQAVVVIGDEGPGFDVSKLPDPTDPANLEKPSGRGLFLIRRFMDEVNFNQRGNEITMIKRCRQAQG